MPRSVSTLTPNRDSEVRKRELDHKMNRIKDYNSYINQLVRPSLEQKDQIMRLKTPKSSRRPFEQEVQPEKKPLGVSKLPPVPKLDKAFLAS